MELKRVAIILEGRVQYERHLLLGIRDFVSEAPHWLIRLELPGHTSPSLSTSRPDGILFQAAGLNQETLKALEQTETPCLHLSDEPEGFAFTHVGLDNRAIGCMAAQQFSDGRFACHVFVEVKGLRFSRIRRESFVEALADSGKEVRVLQLSEDHPDEARVVAQLKALPKPAAVFATHDECSLYLTTLCRGAGIRVPEEVAILGVDNDQLICELAFPKLSSIAVPSRRVGREAAERLDQWMRGEGPVESVLLPPSGIVERHSTDIAETEDETVNRALHYMRTHLQRRINVDDVLRETGVSRRLLERRFQTCLGRSPLQELQRQRLELAERMLVEGDAPLHEIAARCGFRDASHLVTQFRKKHGETPGAFRKRALH